MFCPNCGAQNDDTAMACTKCGHQLKAASAPKFKGTMLMMNAPAIPRPGAGGPGGAPQQPPGGAPQQPPAAAPPGGPSGGPPGGVTPKPKLKGTMIGVAPPSLGSNAPAGAVMPPSVGPGPTPGAPGAPGAGQPPQGQPEGQQQPPSEVNPLGGTMVADAGAFGGGMLAAPPPAPPQTGGLPPGADPNAGPPPSAEAGLGAPPPGFGGGAAAGGQPQGFGIDQALQQAGGPPPTAGAQPLDQGGALAGGPPQAQGQDASSSDIEPVPGMVGGPNPVVTVLLIVLTCGIYGIYLLVKNKKGG